jgi:transposase
MGKKDKKEQFLEAAGALNPKPQQVEDRKFRLRQGFFDPRDKVQVKYEMLRAHEIDGESVSEAAPRFGYTRESFYTSKERFDSEGIPGLVDRKRGRKGPDKLTEEILEFLGQSKRQDPRLSGARLCEMVNERYGVELHKRTVEKAVAGRVVGQKKPNAMGTGQWRKSDTGGCGEIFESWRRAAEALRTASGSRGTISERRLAGRGDVAGGTEVLCAAARTVWNSGVVGC